MNARDEQGRCRFSAGARGSEATGEVRDLMNRRANEVRERFLPEMGGLNQLKERGV